jgi:hypothetical protein
MEIFIVSPLNGDTSLTHVTRLAAHPTTPPTPTAMEQSFYNDPVLFLRILEISKF